MLDMGLEKPIHPRLSTPEVIEVARKSGELDVLERLVLEWRLQKPEDVHLRAMEGLIAFALEDIAGGVEAVRAWAAAQTEPITVENLTASWLLESTPVGEETADLVADLGEALLSTSLEIQYKDARTQLLQGWLGPEKGRARRSARVADVLFSAVLSGGPSNTDQAAVFLGHNLEVIVGEAPDPAQGDLAAALVARWMADPLAKNSPVRTRDGLSALIHRYGPKLSPASRTKIVEAALTGLFPDGPQSAPRLRDWRRKDPELARFPFVRLLLELIKDDGGLTALAERWANHPVPDSVDLLFLRRELADVLEDADLARSVVTSLRDKTRWSNYLRVGSRRRRQGQADKALSALERGRNMASDPVTQAAFDCEIAACFELLGRGDEARMTWLRALQADPNGLDLAGLWPVVLEPAATTPWVDFSKVLEARIERDAQDFGARTLLAAFHLRAGETDRALAVLKAASEARRSDKEAPRIVVLRGLAQALGGASEEAQATREAFQELLGQLLPDPIDTKLLAELDRVLGGGAD